MADDTAACAARGNYTATFCVGYAGDAGVTTNAPTCKQIMFAWPSSSPTSTISATITPTR
jgi:hypothetical protein